MSYYDGNHIPPPVVPIPVPAEASVGPNESQCFSTMSLSQRSAVEVDEGQVKRLKDQGFTSGLASSLSATKAAFPLRIWIVDNSGSMQKDDGHRIVETKRKDDVKIVPCTRWDEIRECVNYHSQMSALLEAPTHFRLLNHPGVGVGSQQFSVAEAGLKSIDSDVQNATRIMNRARPGGVTPLTQHIREIHGIVDGLTPQLISEGKRIAIIIATDGLPTDDQGTGGEHIKQQFIQSLRLLEGLPVWVVIRLCTDETDVVDFYNQLDEELELSMEVLDDFTGEAEEVHEQNPWLNYCLPLHRLREMGFQDRIFDMLDERLLTKGELRDFCVLLFGLDKMDGVPDPSVDWTGFLKNVESLLKGENSQWNPIKKKVMPWIDTKKLHKSYGDGSACAIM